MLTIEEAQSMTLTQLHVDNTSVVVAVLSGERLAYGGGRYGFGGAVVRVGGWSIEVDRYIGEDKLCKIEK